METETPMRRQYLEIKRRYPHALLLFRLGDFYEAFDEDAKLVARELDIVLTSRPVGKGVRVPLAGIPHHALDSYLARLVARGHKVAICEQVEGLSKGKNLMERRVMRVVTPGTVTEPGLLEQGSNNFLAAVALNKGNAGLAHVDVSTGEFACAELPVEALPLELERLRPAELLLPSDVPLPEGLPTAVTRLQDGAAPGSQCRQVLLDHFQAVTLAGLGLEGLDGAASASGAILGYLAENGPGVLPFITRLTVYSPDDHMVLDGITVRNLEVFLPLQKEGRSLLATVDLTKTAMGSRLLRRWLGQPLLNVSEINERQDRIQLFVDSAVLRSRVIAPLAKIPDLERLLGRVGTGVAGPRELVSLGRGLNQVAELRTALDTSTTASTESGNPALLPSFPACDEAMTLIRAALADDPGASIQEGGVIRPGFSPDLDRLRSAASDANDFLVELERGERERIGVKSIKVGHNKVFGYYIEVSKSNLEMVPSRYRRLQTLVGAERFTIPELQEHERRILQVREQQLEREQSLFRQVCTQVAALGQGILEAAAAVAQIDVHAALAEVATRYRYVRPEVHEGTDLEISDGRHPVVEQSLDGRSFVPNDTLLSCDESQIVVLTGPNMAGKSTYLRQVALAVLLAQIGSFVPAASARIGIVDRIFTRIGALDDIAAGRSTFLVEMLETAAILHGATPRSLLLFDEIGRGTSTYDGIAIARAVIEFIHNRPDLLSKTLFATHYHELVELADSLPRVCNFNVAVTEEGGRVVFLHRILPGGADRSYGVHVAHLAGMPKPVIQRAHELLEELEARGKALSSPEGHDDVRKVDRQMLLFAAREELLEELSSLDPDSLTPLGALTALYDLRERAKRQMSP